MSDQKAVMKDMLANAVHFGHRSSKWNPKMAPYLHSKRNGVHIFDLNHSVAGLEKAKDFLTQASKQGRTILFVSTKQQSTQKVKEAAEKCKMPYVTSKWIPGLLTNFGTIKKRVDYLLKLKDEEVNGGFEKYTKKEASDFKKQIQKLEAALGGVVSLERKPDVLFVLDVVRDHIAVKEAKKVGITVVGVCDSNADPDGVDYMIPGNDDAIKAIDFFVGNVQEAILAGR